ncbi:MAG: zinc-ribbon domain-containing protein [Candidatus Viridilinea halotolerans]|uniref:Zinc-ribbon domain-containing protein n=1 Tax=Candidatus Viridilinea halotolerans TaxID=2491704 RepID=A0A426TQL7_9CHLR|nr:MAG: zinc-ribbon domain-containing protein [Candidatus Viridilinea halotolerans]
MQCSSCGTQLPEDAHFCIECGADVSRQVNTGATVALSKEAKHSQVACNACGAANPSFAIFCVRCGQRVGAMPVAPPPTPVRHDLDVGEERRLSYSPPPPPRAAPRQSKSGWEPAALAIFFVGFALLLLLPIKIFPGILALIGVSTFVSEALRGRAHQAVQSVIWLFGLTVLFTVPRLFFPGIIILVGLSMLWSFLHRQQQP